MSVRVITGDCRDVLASLEPGSVQCVVTTRLGLPAHSSSACSTSARGVGAIGHSSRLLPRRASVAQCRLEFCGLGRLRLGPVQLPGSAKPLVSSGSNAAACVPTEAQRAPWLCACDGEGIGLHQWPDRPSPQCQASQRLLPAVPASRSRRTAAGYSVASCRCAASLSGIPGFPHRQPVRPDTRLGIGRGRP